MRSFDFYFGLCLQTLLQDTLAQAELRAFPGPLVKYEKTILTNKPVPSLCLNGDCLPASCQGGDS